MPDPKDEKKAAVETSPHNKNPNGPDKKYNKVEQALYDANFKLGTLSTLNQEACEYVLDNLGVRHVTIGAAADGTYDAGVQNRKNEQATKKPSQGK